jgi:hypothetical protein
MIDNLMAEIKILRLDEPPVKADEGKPQAAGNQAPKVEQGASSKSSTNRTQSSPLNPYTLAQSRPEITAIPSGFAASFLTIGLLRFRYQ